MTMRRFRRADPEELTDAYVVETREARGQRWQRRGLVARAGTPPDVTWNALADGGAAWTNWLPTRGAAAEEMLAGHTHKTREAQRHPERAWYLVPAPEPPPPEARADIEAG
jgi:hypothetical protein